MEKDRCHDHKYEQDDAWAVFIFHDNGFRAVEKPGFCDSGTDHEHCGDHDDVFVCESGECFGYCHDFGFDQRDDDAHGNYRVWQFAGHEGDDRENQDNQNNR